MTHRWLVAAMLVAGIAISGCSSAGKTATSGSSSSASTGAAPPTKLDTSQCGNVTGANTDLLNATDTDTARKAADTLEKYNPPAKVNEGIEHFVTTGGGQFDDPDYTKYNQIVGDWVKAVCPT